MREPVEELIREYKNHLFAVAFSICKSASDADDVVQDTFMKYHFSKKKFSSREHIRAWLLRVAINKAKDVNRSFWKQNSTSIEDYIETLELPNSDDRDLLSDVLALPEKYRIVIHLHYYEAEIAELLSLSESNVKIRLSRGRSMLKARIQEEWSYE